MMRRPISVIVSVLVLALLYAAIDVRALASAIRSADLFWLGIGLLMLVPLTIATAWRFTVLTMDAHVGFAEANRLVLAASTLNLFLPSKLGDLAKAYVLSARHGMNGELALSVVVFEKALDMVSLLLLGACAAVYVGLSSPETMVFAVPVVILFLLFLTIILPVAAFPSMVRFFAAWLPHRLAARLKSFAEGATEVAAWFWRRRIRAIGVLVLSVAIWGAHLVQFWLFTRAVGGTVPLVDTMAFATLSILVGLLPFTLAGIGSRDLAIVYFFASYLTPAAGAFLGILATLRYVLPAIAGVPFVGDLAAAASAQRLHVQAGQDVRPGGGRP